MRINKFVLVFWFVGIFVSSFAQKYTNNQFIIFSYSLDIDQRVKQELMVFEKYIQFKPVLQQEKIEAVLVHTLYNIVTKTFTDSLNIFFLPPNNLSDKVNYNAYGYPEIVIQKAIRLSDTKYFMKIQASIENSRYNEKGIKISSDNFLPLVNISFDIYNKFGFNPIQSAEGQALAHSPVKINKGFISGMNFISQDIAPEDGVEPLKKIMERAVIDALHEILVKKQR
jgi:hypothetical protein